MGGQFLMLIHSICPSLRQNYTEKMGATRQRKLWHRSTIQLAVLAAAATLLFPTLATAAGPSPRVSTRLRQSQETPSLPTYTVTLAPCTPLPVLSNCSAVPQAFHDNVEGCAHISFSAFGQKATTAHLSFVLVEEEGENGVAALPEVHVVREDAGEEWIEVQSRGDSGDDDGKRKALEGVSLIRAGTQEGEVPDIKGIKSDYNESNAVALGKDSGSKSSGTTLTMVLLVGSELYFLSQAEMYEFMQPKVAAAMREKGLYDPTYEGPCASSGSIDDISKNTSSSSSSSSDAQPALEELGEENTVLTSETRRQRRLQRGIDDNTEGNGISTCADVVEAFNSEGGGDEATYAHLYTCNITASTPDGSSPVMHRLSFDGLLPESFPYTYWVFLNINPVSLTYSSSSSLSLSSLSVNQTVRYEAAFSPPFVPSSSKVVEPLFAILLLVAVLYFVLFSRYVSNPTLDWLSTTRWGKRCLRGGLK